MPDNGFGNKANSRSFALRLYRVKPRWDRGTVQVREAVTLSDPDGKVPFPIVNETTDERILTGGDFDIESVRRTPDGTLWFGEEFGPFIVHTDAKGRVLDAPVPLPRVFSPDNPFLLGRQSEPAGFERLRGDGALARRPHALPVPRGRADRRRPARPARLRVRRQRTVATPAAAGSTASRSPALFVSDAVAFGRDQLDRHRARQQPGPGGRAQEGVPGRRARPQADPQQARAGRPAEPQRPEEAVAKGARDGDFGLGNPFKFPYVTVEAVLPSTRTSSCSSTTRSSARPAATRPAGLLGLHRAEGARPQG